MCELSDSEIEIISTPIRDLTPEMRLIAFSISDKIVAYNYSANKNFKAKNTKITIQDKDILLKNGVKSQVDGKAYGNRRDYNDHLKRYDMVEVGDQAPTKAPKEMRGDFECRRELQEAFKQHLG